MRIRFMPILFLVVSLVACKSNEGQDKIMVNTETEIKTGSHNSENSLDCEGAYQGTLPCADCEGIQTKIVLNKDSSYEKEFKYLGKDGETFKESGQFKWDENGSHITLSTANGDNQADTDSYLVGENKLIKLDSNGNRIQGNLTSHYELAKQTSK